MSLIRYGLYFSIGFAVVAGSISVYVGLSHIKEGGIATTLSIMNLLLAAGCFFMAWLNYGNLKRDREMERLLTESKKEAQL